VSGIGPEIIIVAVVLLLVFGSKKIPEFARGLGQAKAEFEKGQSEAPDEEPDET
jgi:sec-independent protein translocase protein TatA